MNEQERIDELQHYGVVGMKWGVRRARKSFYKRGDKEKADKIYTKTFSKAVNKANKLNRKATDKNLKAAKLQKKALKKETKATNDKQYQKARKTQFKANKLNLQSAKLQKKSAKWERKMEEHLSTIKLSEVNKKTLDEGKKYAYMLFDDSKAQEYYRKSDAAYEKASKLQFTNEAERKTNEPKWTAYMEEADKYMRKAEELESEVNKKRRTR